MPINRRNLRSRTIGLLVCLAACGLILALALPSNAQAIPDKKRVKSKPSGNVPNPNPFSDGGLAGPGGMGPVGSRAGFGGPVPGGGGLGGPQTNQQPMRTPQHAYDAYSRDYGRADSVPPPPATAWDAASVPREVVLDWAMTATPSRDDLADLEVLLEKAYQTNPQVIAAQAELQQAQAAVERARMEVARRIINTRAQWEVRRRAVQCLSDALAKTPDNDQLLQQYVDARAKLAQIEMELPFLGLTQPKKGPPPYRTHALSGEPVPRGMGLGGPGPQDNIYRVVPVRQNPLGPTAVSPEIQNALQKKVDVEADGMSVSECIFLLSAQAGVQFVISAELGGNPDEVVLHLKAVTLAGALQALEDYYPGLCFVVRPYGILVTSSERAATLTESQGMRAISEPIMPRLTGQIETTMPGPALEDNPQFPSNERGIFGIPQPIEQEAKPETKKPSRRQP